MPDTILSAYRVLYEQLARPVIFTQGAQAAHEHMLTLLRGLDALPASQPVLAAIQRITQPPRPVTVGGVTLNAPLMLAAGFVKGEGFPDEDAALAAVESDHNVMPGWASVPALCGLVEFGSFTRWPRLGNPGTVVWRHADSRSTQNRVGLKNPGARAAAAFLAKRRDRLPAQFGINVAVSPGVSDPPQEQREVAEAFGYFRAAGIQPAWWTLNVSCPNTEDDPGARQTESRTRDVCQAALDALAGQPAPLWVKVSPDLAPDQYRALMRVFAEMGIPAVIATNTLAQPAPGRPDLSAGIGGGRLHRAALDAVGHLVAEQRALDCPVDVIGCGGVLDGDSFGDFAALGIRAAQYWSALIYRGPLAAALIASEFEVSSVEF
jgi:dihydroorotate dehydrogenase